MTNVVSGTYAPSNVDEGDPDTIDNLPANSPPPVTTMGLGGFYGINPNGTWPLLDPGRHRLRRRPNGRRLDAGHLDYRPNAAPVANNDTYTGNRKHDPDRDDRGHRRDRQRHRRRRRSEDRSPRDRAGQRQPSRSTATARSPTSRTITSAAPTRSPTGTTTASHSATRPR